MDFFEETVARANEGTKLVQGKLFDLFYEGKLTFEEWSLIGNAMQDVRSLVKAILR